MTASITHFAKAFFNASIDHRFDAQLQAALTPERNKELAQLGIASLHLALRGTVDMRDDNILARAEITAEAFLKTMTATQIQALMPEVDFHAVTPQQCAAKNKPHLAKLLAL